MTYRAIGLMSGSSLDGLDLVFTELTEAAGTWSFAIGATACYPYDALWTERLVSAIGLPAREYLLLHSEYGHYLGAAVNRFIDENDLHYKVGLIASHGHTTFHLPGKRMTAQLGDGAAIAAVTGLPVISDLRALDVAFGGQGAPIVPIAEKLLFPGYTTFLNLGGIANLSVNDTAFDVCPANRVLNLLAATKGLPYDDGGRLAAAGTIDAELLSKLNSLPYYGQPFPKSLANDFGTDTVYPLLQSASLPTEDAAATYVAHIAAQVAAATRMAGASTAGSRMLVTGGGAHNGFLVGRIGAELAEFGIEVVVPDAQLVNNKEALAMALIGVLRWRQESTVLSSVTGAQRDSIGGAVWIGQEA
jgi:anhydro-N-acetylmuramic acid kinase